MVLHRDDEDVLNGPRAVRRFGRLTRITRVTGVGEGIAGGRSRPGRGPGPRTEASEGHRGSLLSTRPACAASVVVWPLVPHAAVRISAKSGRANGRSHRESVHRSGVRARGDPVTGPACHCAGSAEPAVCGMTVVRTSIVPDMLSLP